MFTIWRIAYKITGVATGTYTFVELIAGGIDPYASGMIAVASGIMWPVPLAYNAYCYAKK